MTHIVQDTTAQAVLDGDVFSTGPLATIGPNGDYFYGFTVVSPIVVEFFEFATLINDFRAFLYEGYSATGGTTLPFGNRNRNSSKVPDFSATANATFDPTGKTPIFQLYLWANQQRSTTPPTLARAIVLRANTNYVLQLHNGQGSTQDVATTLIFRKLLAGN